MAMSERGWLQYKLRTLLVLITALAVLLGAVQFHPARQQSLAADALRKLGAVLRVEATGAACFRSVVGEEYFVDVRECYFLEATITDADLEHLRPLANLHTLYLFEFDVSDPALAHFEGLTNLQRLSVRGEGITDAGLEHLKSLTNLQYLELSGTRVTDEGVAGLKKALPRVSVRR